MHGATSILDGLVDRILGLISFIDFHWRKKGQQWRYRQKEESAPAEIKINIMETVHIAQIARIGEIGDYSDYILFLGDPAPWALSPLGHAEFA